ncbi:MAG: glycosyltransferase [Rubrivivax sp.]|nr:glycosyltransferase [Rubrivivax sp.]
MKRVLMIAFHFPPLAGSSGIQRTLRFMQHLPASGWQPLVLSAHPRVYERTSTDLDAEVPASVVVRRAFALDTARDLAIGGRYPGMLARPDRWMSWRFDGVRQGLQMVREFRPDAIWSTYPIASAHVIGAELQRRTGLPWIADFRDPMAQQGYPADPKTWAAFDAIEARAARQARQLCFTTPSAAALYRQRYPDAAERISVLENGFDEDSFASAQAALGTPTPLNPGRLTLLHSGTIYPAERDPTHLIAGLAQLKAADPALASRLCLRFRAPVHGELLQTLAASAGVTELIEVLPPVGYGEALAEMLRADALLVLQASNCNEQVPAKLYEYLRAGRPIVCLSDPLGDTCAVLRDAGVTRHAGLDDAGAIAALLGRVAAGDDSGLTAPAQGVAAASRSARSAQLAALLDASIAPRVASS